MEASREEPTVLLATTPESEPVLRRMLDGTAHAIAASCEEEALRLLDAGVRLAICSVRFDESRMLEFLLHATREHPRVPCICCRIAESELPASSLEAARVAAINVGAIDFVDLPVLRARYGDERALAFFRDVVRNRLEADTRSRAA